ncbi:translocon-associated protein beta (TRAPB) family protein [Zea mays]|uniref:Translocon-associated protein beta (TRAPB) family protein n=1 Tax=Zea mays TaxID=4577 RepID=A0A1D6MWX3_MAIZE|nr:translocon-associated protein beta (TRAPB) family protein [Zea mays]ONM33259.1 translocon-associated protein beta (TRAPB) family protein [Zea mays]
MARCLALVALLVLGLAAAASAADAPFVVAHKKISLSRPKPGVERVAVSLDLYNQGSATAYDVSINDDSWPTEVFELVTGEKSKTLERLDPGATASHTYVLETKTQGRFQGSPAIITYREAYSTPIFPLDILAERPPEKKFEWVKACDEIRVTCVCCLFCWTVYLPCREPVEEQLKGKQEETLIYL